MIWLRAWLGYRALFIKIKIKVPDKLFNNPLINKRFNIYRQELKIIFILICPTLFKELLD